MAHGTLAGDASPISLNGRRDANGADDADRQAVRTESADDANADDVDDTT